MASVSHTPDDYLDDMAECLLFYFNRDLWLKVKNEIEETYDIKTWPCDKIFQALEIMEEKHDPKVKQWACVITFQIMEIQDYVEHVRIEAESILAKSETVEQPPVILKSDASDRPDNSSQSNVVVCPPLSTNSLEDELSEGISSVSLPDSSSRSSQSKAKPIQSSSAKHEQPQDNPASSKANNSNRSSQSNANKNDSRSNKKNEQPQGTLLSGRSNNSSQSNLSFSENRKKRNRSENPSTIGIKIPLSELFGSEAHTENAETVHSKYKLTDGYPSGTIIIKKKSYVSSYNENTRNAEWVFEILNKKTLAMNVKGNHDFHECRRILNYDRGHLAAAANHRWCKEAYIDTYKLINISPQDSVLNRRTWKYLENMCRKKVNDQKNVHVYTGTIILNSRYVNKTEQGQAVPDYFYKVIVEENNDGTVQEPMCYLVYNDKTKVKHDLKDWKMSNEELHDFLKQKYRIHIENINKNEKDENNRNIENINENETTGNTMNIMNIERTEENIEDIKDIIGKIFVNPAPVYTDEIRSVKWTEEGNGDALHSVHIEVRMSIPENSNNNNNNNNPTVQ